YHSARGHEHAHLICRSCQKVISIGLEEMEQALGGLAGQHGFSPDYGHLTVFGTCVECAEK
ncbi:MAG: Fur family transcriptional regulator, partial [Marmoricola sp.]|nr:Fur family transcriptional regulator [Marmoricola sp.]